MQVIGLCRFSYPAKGGFQVEHDTIEQRIQYLYGAQRLEERFRLFEHVALPCLRQQTDQDFQMVIVIGDSMPAEHAHRLLDLTDGVDQIRVEAHPPRNHREMMKEILNRARTDPSKPCLQFRFDDDDAVSVDFVKRLRNVAASCQGLLDANRTVAIDFSRGYLLESRDQTMVTAEVIRPYFTAALGMYVAGKCQQTIMNFSHTKIHQFMPSITMSDEPMWLRTHNTYNDSRQGKVKQDKLESITPQQEAEFKVRFGLKMENVAPTLSHPDR